MMIKQSSNNLSEQELVQLAKTHLDQSVEDISQVTAIKLQAARRRALDKAKSRHTPGWVLPVGGLATAATVTVLTVSLWTTNPVPTATPVFDDMALLSGPEDLEFLDELEFYEWLEEDKDVS